MKKREMVICFLAVIAVLSFFIQLPIQNKPPETFEGVAYLSKAQKFFSEASKCYSQKKYSLAIGYFDQALELIDKAELSLPVKTMPSGEKTKLQKDFHQLRNTINSFKKHVERILHKSISL